MRYCPIVTWHNLHRTLPISLFAFGRTPRPLPADRKPSPEAPASSLVKPLGFFAMLLDIQDCPPTAGRAEKPAGKTACLPMLFPEPFPDYLPKHLPTNLRY